MQMPGVPSPVAIADAIPVEQQELTATQKAAAAMPTVEQEQEHFKQVQEELKKEPIIPALAPAQGGMKPISNDGLQDLAATDPTSYGLVE